MATYVFKCASCARWVETQFREPAPSCISDDHTDELVMKRAYALEGVGFAIASLRDRRNNGAETDREMRDLFLETAEEAATPDDPDGSKAIREWNETHDPKPGNKAPLRPEMPLGSKTTFGGFEKKVSK